MIWNYGVASRGTWSCVNTDNCWKESKIYKSVEWVEKESLRNFVMKMKHCVSTAAFVAKLAQMKENSYCFICHVCQCCQRNFWSTLKFYFSSDLPSQPKCFWSKAGAVSIPSLLHLTVYCVPVSTGDDAGFKRCRNKSNIYVQFLWTRRVVCFRHTSQSFICTATQCKGVSDIELLTF